MYGKSTATTPAGYIKELTEPHKSEIKRLHEFIVKTAPSLKPFMMGGMMAYGPFRFTYATGKKVDWSILALASQKHYISLYVCVADGKQYIAEKYKKDLPGASIGKSCIRFKKLEDLDRKVLAKILKEAESWAKKQKKK